jgi:protein O-GlcNAc transferase
MNIEKTFQQAIKHHQVGQLDDAEQWYRKILQTEPKHPDANHNLGILMVQKSQPDAALAFFNIAIESNPCADQFWVSYIDTFIHLRQLSVMEKILELGRSVDLGDEAFKQLETYLQSEYKKRKSTPTQAEIDSVILLTTNGQQKDVQDAIEILSQKYSNELHFYNLSATCFSERGKFIAVVKCYQHVIDIKPESPVVHNNLGLAFHSLSQFDEAIQSFSKAFTLKPDYAEAYFNVGITLSKVGHLDDAVRSYQIALKINPNFADAHNNLGNILSDLGQLDKAINNFIQAIKIKPDYAEAYNNYGITLKKLGQFNAAVKIYQKTLAVDPDYALGHYNLGNIYKDLGQLDAAVKSYEKALTIKPKYIEAHNNRLFTFNYLTNYDSDFNLKEARKFGIMLNEKVTSRFTDFQGSNEPARLRVGLVSGDFRMHAVGYFLESVCSQLTKSKVELVAYATCAKFDDLSARIKPYFSDWKALYSLTDEMAANLIHNDNIHILIDLSGHTAHNRLPIFAFKPAPVQVSWLGYFATTGLAQIDYIVGDPHVTPLENQSSFIEKIWQLPESRWCFTPPNYSMNCERLPALDLKYITFGCFNNYTKLNDTVVALWAKILNHVSDSRLYLKANQFEDQTVREEVIQRFLVYGIDAKRITLEGFDSREKYFLAYQHVDIALDPFPFTGGTTTVEALWMGVPVLTLEGNSLVSRQGVGILINAGLPNWIAKNQNDYLAKAISFTTDLDKLALLRLGLRKRVLDSPLFDAVRFSKNLENALWKMWQQQNSTLKSGQVSTTDEN